MNNEQQNYEELTITNNFIFCKVMQSNPNLCKQLVELIINRKISHMVAVNSEQTIEITPDGKGIRLDVYFEDDGSTMYDIEMQVESNKNLARRSRFYQNIMDSQALGKNSDYIELMDSYVIFICPFNILPEYGYHLYHFRPRADEDSSIILDDGTSRIFVCAKGNRDDVSVEMKDFLDYLSGKLAGSQLTSQLDDAVKLARLNQKWRTEYMLSKIDIDVMKGEYERELAKKDAALAEKDNALAEMDNALAEKDNSLIEKDARIAELEALLANLTNKDS
ncbi:Rpn family recombination-promoting nuclease/putative transposase [Butyrivibrio sp. AC2005]|uniref:Rpn family recombination-promoting nuclease/putative transposase n=1 Tax=Butyrivibrio sp. AC2005 TaxID=1280672 RepID=UPI000677FF1C|nr:Rpn family recombination-promoting nuclease/putative transposase [Butyrivibrio sp. AC2005]